MGTYTIPCRACGKLFMWFSGNLDQRCRDCVNAPDLAGSQGEEVVERGRDRAGREAGVTGVGACADPAASNGESVANTTGAPLPGLLTYVRVMELANHLHMRARINETIKPTDLIDYAQIRQWAPMLREAGDALIRLAQAVSPVPVKEP